jgi:hypothetical protein
LDLLIAAAIADRIATAGALIFRVQFFCFCNYVIDIFFVMAPSGPVPFTDSSLMWFFGNSSGER